MRNTLLILVILIGATSIPSSESRQHENNSVIQVECTKPDHKTSRRSLLTQIENRNTIELLLEQKVNLAFIDLPLVDSIDFLSERYGIRFWFDEQSLKGKGIDINEPTLLQVEGITIFSALNLALSPIGVGYYVDDEVVVISTIEKAKAFRDTRVYNLNDLLQRGHKLSTLKKALTQNKLSKAVSLCSSIVITQSQPAHRTTRAIIAQLRSSSHFPSVVHEPDKANCEKSNREIKGKPSSEVNAHRSDGVGNVPTSISPNGRSQLQSFSDICS